MASGDPCLTCISRALRQLGSAVSLEVSPSGGRLPLRGSLPMPDGSWKQKHISTAFPYPAGVDQARQLAEELRALGKGYSPLKDAAPRDLPSDQVIAEVIDALPSCWQWVAGICATHGVRPHEALLMATVESSGLVVIQAAAPATASTWTWAWPMYRPSRKPKPTPFSRSPAQR